MIWVIAGTKNARDLITRLHQEQYPLVATTVSSWGKDLIGEMDNVITLRGELDENQMTHLIKRYHVRLIIDASHPYAREVSNNALSASQTTNIPIIRFDREQIHYQRVKEFPDYSDIADYLKDKKGNILLTIGSKNVSYFKEKSDQKIFARILPLAASIEHCLASGININRIIAMNFPFSKSFNQALLKELNIRFLVTKESGKEGGFEEKVSAALALNIDVLMLKRPEVIIKDTYYSIEEIIKETKALMHA